MAASTDTGRKPKLIVFDLDYTLWPFWVDTHVDPPFKKTFTGNVIDSVGRVIKYYKDVADVLKRLHKEGYILAVASRTGAPVDAQSLIDLFDWNKYFSYKEIYPGRKTTHFSRIQRDSGIAYSDMIFFDDESRNILDIGKLGVLAKHIDGEVGVTKAIIEETLQEYARR